MANCDFKIEEVFYSDVGRSEEAKLTAEISILFP